MLRVALIDYGSRTAAALATANRLQHVAITAVAGSLPHDVPEEILTADSFEELCRQHASEFDAVAIRTPLRRRADVAGAAASAGKHVLLAEPFAETCEASDALVSLCRRHDVCLLAEDCHRRHPYQQTLHSSLNADQLGEPGFLRIHHWFGTDDEPPESLVERIINDMGFANWLLGRPSHIYAAQLNSDDYTQIHLGFENGGSALIDFARVAAPQGYRNVSLIAANGAAYADDHHNSHLVYGNGSTTAVTSDFGMQHWAKQLDHFAQRVTASDDAKESTEPSIAAARDAQLVAHAVAASIESGRSMRWEGDRYECV